MPNTPDASGEGIHGRATRHAAAKVLSRELAIRSDALVAAPDEAITLSPNGRIVWADSEIARLERGENALKPRLQLNADEHLALPERERVMKRLDLWLETQIATKLKPPHPRAVRSYCVSSSPTLSMAGWKVRLRSLER